MSEYTRRLDLDIRINERDYEVDVFEPESGECKQFQFFYEDPEGMRKISDEIFGWISLWRDEDDELRRQKGTRKVLEIAHLVEYLVGDSSCEEKAMEIKQVRDSGYLTGDEALELALEYCSGETWKLIEKD